MDTAERQWQDEGETLADFLKVKAGLFGDRPALYFKPGFRYLSWSYRELWEGAGRVASLLQSRGIGKGDRVLLWAPNCPQWVLAYFGCVRAGVVLVPLDLRSAPEFVARVSSKTRPKLAFVSSVTPGRPEGFDVPELLLDRIEQESSAMPEPGPVDLVWNDLVEVMFTSGTTGDPKGVMLTHGNLLSNMAGVTRYVSGKPTDRLLSILPLSHMFEQMGGLLVPLKAGANVTYLASLKPSVLLATAMERRPTLMLLVPQALDLLMKSIEREVARQGKQRLWELSHAVAGRMPNAIRRIIFRRVLKRLGGALQFVFSGGAALDPELGAKWERLGIRVIQGYGATEASPVISCHTMERPDFRSSGPPVPGVEVRVAEDGELLVRGPNVTQGYWEAPGPTAAAFDDGWYKTGDLGLIDEQGFVHVRGRKKDMIVLPNGQNVYPEDVEAVVARHPEVTDATVVGLPKDGAVQVHAVLLMEQPGKASAAVAWANGQLADHQQVRGYTVWPDNDLPRTHTFKVKKPVVLDRLTRQGDVQSQGEAPKEDTRKGRSRVRLLIAEVAGVSPALIRPDASLGETLEMDSLKRVELLSAIEEETGVYVDETQVGAGTTVRQLEVIVRSNSRTSQVPFPLWGMSLWCRLIRGLIQRLIIFPAMAMAYKTTVTGAENVHVDGPVIVAANHTIHLDNGIILRSMPASLRRRLAIAASDHMWSNPMRSLTIPLLGNGFPFSKEGNVRKSLENIGRIVDGGWSVLIYPEGELTGTGPLRPFLGGTGLICVGGRIPVVPLRVKVRRTGFPAYFPLLRRGDVEVCFGRPLRFGPEVSYKEATAAIEGAVRAL